MDLAILFRIDDNPTRPILVPWCNNALKSTVPGGSIWVKRWLDLRGFISCGIYCNTDLPLKNLHLSDAQHIRTNDTQRFHASDIQSIHASDTMSFHISRTALTAAWTTLCQMLYERCILFSPDSRPYAKLKSAADDESYSVIARNLQLLGLGSVERGSLDDHGISSKVAFMRHICSKFHRSRDQLLKGRCFEWYHLYLFCQPELW